MKSNQSLVCNGGKAGGGDFYSCLDIDAPFLLCALCYSLLFIRFQRDVLREFSHEFDWERRIIDFHV
jgi:hypothetical protein